MIKLSVNEPCHENWAAMTEVEQGRFCGSCQKTVTDFSMMNDREILNTLAVNAANICGRFTSDQLERPLIEERKKKYSLAYLWNFLVASFLTTGYANAQTKGEVAVTSISTKKTDTIPITPSSSLLGDTVATAIVSPNKIYGVVMDSKTNRPISFASIGLAKEGGVISDSAGVFVLDRPRKKDSITISISAIGYAAQEYTVSRSAGKLTFYLEPEATSLKEVVVKAYPIVGRLTRTHTEYCRTVSGAMGSIRTISWTEKFSRQMDDLKGRLLKKEISIYPNPLRAGESFTINLNLPEMGLYALEILNAQGQIVHRGQLNIDAKTQQQLISTSATWMKGIYWVRVSSMKGKKLYNSKISIL